MPPTDDIEAARLSALRDLSLQEDSPSPHFDALCRTAAALFDMPISHIALVEEDHQWFQGKCGLDVNGTPREGSFCNLTILSDEVLVVEDSLHDAHFRDSPLVTGRPHIRFYAGAPLIVGAGLRVGSLCVIDVKPRQFSTQDRQRLRDLAMVATAQLTLHRAEAKLRESESHYRLLADNTSDMVVWSTLDTTRRYVSPAARSLLGVPAETLVGTKPLDQVHPDDAPAYATLLAEVGAGKRPRATSRQRYRRGDGSWVWVEATFGLTYDPVDGHATGYVAAVRDISERKEAERRIAHMACHDALTDLPNRTLFRERLTQALAFSRRRAEEFAVLCLDLDRFKAVNDTLGHHAGDLLLRAVADRLRSVTRGEDTVARLGGDEFVVIQTGPVTAHGIRTLARRIIAALARPVVIEDSTVTIGVSVGISVAPRDGDEADALCRHADLALMHAKCKGRSTFRFYRPGLTFGAAF